MDAGDAASATECGGFSVTVADAQGGCPQVTDGGRKAVQELDIIYKGGGQLYIYPDNLKAKATMWLWQLKDIGIIGVCALLSILALTQAGFFVPIVFTAVYAFLTIRFEDTSILDFIRYACAFFFAVQQFFEWRYTE